MLEFLLLFHCFLTEIAYYFILNIDTIGNVNFRSDFDLFQIELSKNYGNADWREDLKKVMKKAGIENQPTVFLFSDTQVYAISNQSKLK